MEHRYLTTEEVAERYRTSPSTVRYWRMTGYGPAGTQFGRRTLYDLADLEKFDRERRAEDAASRDRDSTPAA